MPAAVLRRSLLQLICIFALLVAQFGALTHAVWHAPGPPPDRAAHFHPADPGHGEDDGHDGGHSSQDRLCSLHALLAAVLGCAGAAAPPVYGSPGLPAQPAPRQLHFRTGAAVVPFLCRGPPAPA